jgi:hypothetical protein
MYNPKVITKRIVWDTRKYEGGENKNEFEIENGKVKFKIRSADNRFLKYDFYVFQKRLNDQGRIMEMENWSERFRHPFDIVSGIEASDEYSKKEMGSFECGSPINWFDLGFEASF